MSAMHYYYKAVNVLIDYYAILTQVGRLYIITAYVPDERHFQSDWKVRRIK